MSYFLIEGMPHSYPRIPTPSVIHDFHYEIVDTTDVNEYLSISLILIDLYGGDFNKVMITNEENSARVSTMKYAVGSAGYCVMHYSVDVCPILFYVI